MFVVPATSDLSGTLPPQILLSSINMTFKNLLTCYERISYTASLQQPQAQTEMITLAEIAAQGSLKSSIAARQLGKKFEEYSMNKCAFPSPNKGLADLVCSSQIRRKLAYRPARLGQRSRALLSRPSSIRTDTRSRRGGGSCESEIVNLYRDLLEVQPSGQRSLWSFNTCSISDSRV